jgi:squalene-hopene/tetraprenyl-beta-curcumene cyclase
VGAISLNLETDAQMALSRAREHVLSLQHPDGWWKGELETNVTMDAEDMLLRQFLGIRDAAESEASAAWIRSQQREDGTWSNFYGGPADLSTTIEAYVALRLAGDDPRAEHMRMASAWVRSAGGIERARVFTHIWLGMFGLWPWERVPALPPEMIFLPPWFPLNVYDFACWARQTIVALSVVLPYRPVRPVSFGLDELRGPEPWRPPSGWSWPGRGLVALDRVLHLYTRRPVRALREAALARAERWIVERQEADGGWGGIQPPWVYSLIALHLRGYPLDHPVIRRGLAGLEGFTLRDSRGRRLEACQSPVWDTALALIALTDAGVPGDDEAVLRGAEWILDEEVRRRGDWAVRRPGLEPGGWAFEFANDVYPDIDDTAEVLLALRAASGLDEARARGALERGLRWLEGMQSSDGGWAAFDADNCRTLARELPFCDFGEVIDPPSADVTAHVVEALAGFGRLGSRGQRGVQWLLEAQEEDGSWFGRWGVNYVYGTGAAVPALVAAGVSVDSGGIRRAVRWLESVQNEDGGWGEDCRSYDDPSAWSGRGASTASQTAWALLALDAAGERSSESARRGIEWLVRSQRADGTWDEPQYTGTGFPGDFYINYHLYRLVFPVMALGRCLR